MELDDGVGEWLPGAGRAPGFEVAGCRKGAGSKPVISHRPARNVSSRA